MTAKRKLNRDSPRGACEEGMGEPHRNPSSGLDEAQTKIEIFGREMIEKRVSARANSGRVYLPPEWIGHIVKIIRID